MNTILIICMNFFDINYKLTFLYKFITLFCLIKISKQEALIWIEQLYYQKTLAANKHRW